MLPSIAAGLAILGLIITGLIVVFSRIPKQTIDNYKEYAQSQDKRIKALEEADGEKGRQIAALQSKVDVLQTIPLADIAKSIKEMVNTQKEIINIIHTVNLERAEQFQKLKEIK